MVKGSGRIFVNGKKLADYIGNRPAIEMLVYRPLVLTETQDRFDVRVKAVGGGVVLAVVLYLNVVQSDTVFQEHWLNLMKNLKMF
ncbi:30S ribosomal protein S9 [Clostridium sp. CAG:813]|nr:30S ribosomal protein S9 [Clostridium sp. CAG:813]